MSFNISHETFSYMYILYTYSASYTTVVNDTKPRTVYIFICEAAGKNCELLNLIKYSVCVSIFGMVLHFDMTESSSI